MSNQRVNWSRIPVPLADGSLTPYMSARRRMEIHDIAFENIGGVEAYSDWARSNKTEFYRQWSRGAVRATHLEVSADEGVEALLARLDAGEHARVIDGTATVVEDEGDG
jgi:hypothetical protein